MLIRPLAAADVPAYKTLRVRGLQDEPVAFGTAADEFEACPEATIVQQWREAAQTPGNFVLGAFVEDRLVGLVGLRRETKPKLRHKALLWGMYVAPEAQGQGCGRALVESVIAKARDVAGLEQILLVVTSEKATARSLYLKLGFEIYGREPRSLKLAETYYDADLMCIQL